MSEKEIYYSCSSIRNGFVFSRSNEICCCCKNYDDETVITKIPNEVNEKSYDEVYSKIIKFQKDMIQSHKSGKYLKICKNCPELEKKKWNDEFSLNSILFAHYKNCNLKCPHCPFLNSDKNKDNTLDETVYNFLHYIYEKIITKCKLNFIVGGGEPSVNSKLEKLYDFAIERDIPTLILSNGARYIPKIAEGIQKGLFSICLSPDAGSKETFIKVKGVDYFDKTWANIEKYCSLDSKNVSVKFILEKANLDDVDNMIKKCVDNHVKKVTLSFDCYLLNNCDLDDFKIAARRFAQLCFENNIDLSVPSGYVPKELIAETLKRFDNSFKLALDSINSDIYLYGASDFLKSFLSRNDIDCNKVKGIIDSNAQLENSKICGIKIFSKEILSNLEKTSSIIITVTHHQKEIKNEILKVTDNRIKILTFCE